MLRSNISNIPAIDFDFSMDDDLLCRHLFHNFRKDKNTTKGLRLKKSGLIFMNAIFENWTLLMPENYIIKSNHLLYLDSTCSLPWYLNNKMIVLFEAELAMRIKLAGDIETLIEVFE